MQGRTRVSAPGRPLRLAHPELVEGRARSGQAWVGPYGDICS